jgi:hypothetical protein
MSNLFSTGAHAECAHCRAKDREIERLRRKNRCLTERIREVFDVVSSLKQKARDEALDQPSGVPRGKWSLWQGVYTAAHLIAVELVKCRMCRG